MLKVKRLTKHIDEVEEKIESEIELEKEKQAKTSSVF